MAKIINKGFQIYCHGVMGFCPYSEYDVKRVDSEEQLNKVEEFELIEYSPENRKIIFSRKRIVQKKYEKIRKNIYNLFLLERLFLSKRLLSKIITQL